MNIAIITARGGSKRVPRKNILPFLGKPIIAYSIEAALASGVFDEVMVSTDDGEIKDIALKYGAKVPFMRSERTSGDFATTSDVLFEVLSRYEDEGRVFEHACAIYPTAPFITKDILKEAYDRFASDESEADTLIPIVSFSYPPQRAYIQKDGYIEFKYPEYATVRSQDLEKQYHDAGQFYFFKTEAFKKSGSLFGGKILGYEIPETQVQDIDTMTDFKLAELKYSFLHKVNDEKED